MKICLFILFAFAFQMMATNTNAQDAIIELKANSITVNQLISEIEKQTDYLVVYSNREVNTSRTVKLKNKSAKVSEYLDETFSGTDIGYNFENNYIVLSKKAQQTANTITNLVRTLQQQGKTVRGTVTENNGEPVIGATIVVKDNPSQGTVTDIDGKFILDNLSESAVLQVSYVGMKQQEIITTGRNSIDVVMEVDEELLDEVIVVGYGTQKRINLTGAVGSVKTEEVLKARPVTNVQELLAGSIPGLVVNKGSGAVGSGANINIRGTSTIGSSSGVLVLIDGIPGNIYTLNPNDIENISILKDAASASIYGSRAANGVILITTKIAKELSRPIVEISSQIGIQNPQFKLDFVGSSDYMRLYDIAMQNDGKDPYFGEQGQQDLLDGKYSDNKWFKEIYESNTLINNMHIALSGNEKSIRYRLSISNDYQDGTLPNNEYNRLIIKPDLRFQMLKNLEAGFNMQYTQTNIHNPNQGTTHWQSQASRISPITSIKENGLYGVGDREGNPIAGVNESGYSKEMHKEMLMLFNIQYSPINNWNIKGTAATYTNNNSTKNRARTYHLYDADGNIARTQNLINSLRESNAYSYRTQLQLTSDYSFSYKETSNFTFLAGYSQEYFKTENFWASRDRLPFDNIDVLDSGSENRQNGGNAQDVAIQSFFGRINYDYLGKYLFETTLRSDGSSRFADGYRWGVFPSVSAGWNIHREDFAEKLTWLSEMKIRASWGTLGDAEKVGYYPTAQVLTYNPKIYTFNNTLIGGAYTAASVNRNITWEVAEQRNLGIDIGVWDQKFKLTMDYFINNRKNILYTPPVPTEFGLSAPISNLLQMKNSGFEFLAAYADQVNDFSWGINLNFSSFKNKVIEMGESNRWVEGNVITLLNEQYQLPYGYEAEGLFKDEEDIANHAKQGNVMPGNIKFKDQDQNGVIDGDDRVVLNRKVPFNYGSNIQLGYKSFDFSANLYGRLNVKRYISGYEGWAFYLSQNARPMHKDAWSPSNIDASYPRLTLTNTANDTQYNSFWLRNANYLKIQNIQIGYSIPKTFLNKFNIEYLRFYLSGQNLATLTSYDGFDPEGSWYPLSRTFSFGLNLQF